MAAKTRQAAGAAKGRGERSAKGHGERSAEGHGERSAKGSAERSRRTYGDRCGVARALDMVGERWALLVVRELLLGPKRFTDLRAGLPHVSTDILAQRLRELEQSGVVTRAKLPPPAGSRVYELTERGRELEPVVLALGRWGSRAPFPDGDARIGVDAFVIALKTLFDPAADLEATVDLRLAGQQFRARVADGRFEVARGEAERPDVTITGEPGPLAAALWHGRPLDADIDGDRDLAARFLALFPPPDKRRTVPA